ncbi:MAG: hypothetical protein U0638_12560 [Phycisphaerales bacterium]
MSQLKVPCSATLAPNAEHPPESLQIAGGFARLFGDGQPPRRRVLIEALAELLSESTRSDWVETVTEVLDATANAGASSAELARTLCAEFREANWRDVCREIAACVLDEAVVYPGRLLSSTK